MIEFIKAILIENEFKQDYIESLIYNETFLTQDDADFYHLNKRRATWRTRIFNKLEIRSFTKQGKNYWIYRGYSELEARDLVNCNRLHRNKPTPMQKEFWIERGMSEEEAIFKIKSSRKTQIEYWKNIGRI